MASDLTSERGAMRMKNEPHFSVLAGALLAGFMFCVFAGRWSFVVGAAIVLQAMTVYVLDRNYYRNRNGTIWYPIEIFALSVLTFNFVATQKSFTLREKWTPITLDDILGISSAILFGLWCVFAVWLLREQKDE